MFFMNESFDEWSGEDWIVNLELESHWKNILKTSLIFCKKFEVKNKEIQHDEKYFAHICVSNQILHERVNFQLLFNLSNSSQYRPPTLPPK